MSDKKVLRLVINQTDSMTLECDVFEIESGFIRMRKVKDLDTNLASKEVWVSTTIVKVFSVD